MRSASPHHFASAWFESFSYAWLGSHSAARDRRQRQISTDCALFAIILHGAEMMQFLLSEFAPEVEEPEWQSSDDFDDADDDDADDIVRHAWGMDSCNGLKHAG